MKKRLDEIVVERGLVSTRSKARGMILAGEVYVNGKKSDKAGAMIAEEAAIEIKSGPDFVSRGGLKLQHALREFAVNVDGYVCVDIGASTGGFTDCLLKNGAKKVYSIDVGYGQLDAKLRVDKRVVVIERMNIRNFDPAAISEPVELVVIDVSFIGLEKVFPKVDEILQTNAPRTTHRAQRVIALIKPQFQVGKGKVGKGGVVRDESLRQSAIEAVKTAASAAGWNLSGIVESPIKGPKGNIEYLGYFIC